MPRGTEEPTVEMIDGFDPAELEEQDTPAEPEAKADDQPDKDKSKKDDDPVYQELRREIRDLRRENRHMVKTIARPSAAAAAPATRKAEPEDDDPQLTVDLTEAVTANDPKALKKALNELGFVSKRDVDRMLAESKAEASKGVSIAQEFPDLVNPKSEFFKVTNAILQDLKAENPGVNEMTLIRLAAKQADAELGGGKPAKRPAVRRRDEDDLDDDDLDIDAEDDRIRRVGRASADGLRRRPSEGRGGEKSNELSAMQKRIVDNLRAAGSTITYETYAKRAGMGVTMSGMPGRGRR
jgi:hypothetical protein